MPDEHGYPTRAELRQIRTFNFLDKEGVTHGPAYMAIVRSAWWTPEWGWRVNQKRERHRAGGQLHRRYRISTGGWSGNEEIISAMQANGLFWGFCWLESRRGGHYLFLVPEPD